jgi:hypothetical protein
MKLARAITFLVLALLSASLLCGCHENKKGPGQKAGEWVDNAAKDAGSAVGDAGDAVRKSTDGK